MGKLDGKVAAITGSGRCDLLDPTEVKKKGGAQSERSTALETGRALFQKGPHAFLMILGLPAPQVSFRFPVQHGAEIHRSRKIDVGLHVAVTD